MPFVTGTADTPTKLLKAMNDHLVANGWTKLRGEEDMAVQAPKAARYWRLNINDTVSTGASIIVRKINFRAGGGGPDLATDASKARASQIYGNHTIASILAGSTSNLTVKNGASTGWWIDYDFGAPVTIREVVIQIGTSTTSGPSDFCLQWSHDRKTWTTLKRWELITWTSIGSQTFSVADSYLDPTHVSATSPRRSGSGEEVETMFVTKNNVNRSFADLSDDIWIWQGPGYDASRRVYIHARGHARNISNTNLIEWGTSIGYNSDALSWSDHPGFSTLRRTHLMQGSTVSYWFYSNSKRIVLITRSGAQDYTSSYVGFLSAFGTPEQYPFPLAILTTMPEKTARLYGEANNNLSSMADPGQNAGYARLWDGTEISPGNRQDAAGTNQYVQNPSSWVWPFHVGSGERPGRWAGGWTGDWNDYIPGHVFDNIIPTRQSHLPMFPCTVVTDPYGNIGSLEGVFAIPSGNILSPLSVLTIGGQDYRVFANRERRTGVNFFVVRED